MVHLCVCLVCLGKASSKCNSLGPGLALYLDWHIFSSHFSCHEKEEVTASESEEERSAAEAKNQRIQKLQGDALNKTDTNMV